jgi:hypothetical protein
MRVIDKGLEITFKTPLWSGIRSESKSWYDKHDKIFNKDLMEGNY